MNSSLRNSNGRLEEASNLDNDQLLIAIIEAWPRLSDRRRTHLYWLVYRQVIRLKDSLEWPFRHPAGDRRGRPKRRGVSYGSEN